MPLHQDRQLRAVVFSDVVDSSVKIFADELIAVQQIKDDLAMLREQLQRHGGSLVKSLGDGLLMTFEAPTQALEFIESVVGRLESRRQRSLAHRFGLHTGEIYADGDDIIGQGVHLASRLQTVSPVNGVSFVRSTYEMIDSRFRKLAVNQGVIDLKGLPEPVEIFSLSPDQLLSQTTSAQRGGLHIEDFLLDTPFTVVREMGTSQTQQTLMLKERQRDRYAVLKAIPVDQQLAEALKLEAATLDRLRHPRIPRVLDYFDRAGLFFFIQEYISGASLHGSMDWLRRKQRLASMLRDVLDVLDVVHAAGLVHGDIHPANLIQSGDHGSMFLVDFSLLRARNDVNRLRGQPAMASRSEIGRPYFTAPERARFGHLTPAADLYALGVSALTLYTGQAPDDLYDQSRGCWTLEDIDPEVCSWLQPLLEDLPAKRLQNARDAMQLLDQQQVLTAQDSDGLLSSFGPIFTSPVVKDSLKHELLSTYGPMVELLLEHQPSLIPADQVAGLTDRLIAAGMGRDDVLAATFAASQRSAPTSTPMAKSSSAVRTMTGDSALDASEPLVAQPARALLQRVIGPIADMLWTDTMTRIWKQDPSRLSDLLREAGVAPESVAEFMHELPDVVARDSAHPVPTSQPSPLPAPDEPEQAGSVQALAEDGVTASPSLARVLNELIGPIGEQLLRDIEDLPEADQAKALMARLQSFGIQDDALNELRRRMGWEG
ncbi:MAG: serine/threonine protein kinase [Cyanobium sp. NAT70]|nr:serine/threonine protein kinase [Cyanobium sp. NAT70]|tara:strand:- start:138 stop:2282 length:2145 start_codon:yes stop_codon:yes gene_type:complete